MKKYFLLFAILLFGCDDDIPNQFTSVEGYVTDYYTHVPVAGISLIVTEIELFVEHNLLDTLLSDSKGYYYFEFYNDSDRYYTIQALTTAIYAPSGTNKIFEGKENKIDIPVKAYIEMQLKCINNSKAYNDIHVFNHEYKYVEHLEDIHCTGDQNCEVLFHIVPEKNIYIQVNLHHKNKMNQIDSSYNTSIEFFSGKNDTTITYYY